MFRELAAKFTYFQVATILPETITIRNPDTGWSNSCFVPAIGSHNLAELFTNMFWRECVLNPLTSPHALRFDKSRVTVFNVITPCVVTPGFARNGAVAKCVFLAIPSGIPRGDLESAREAIYSVSEGRKTQVST